MVKEYESQYHEIWDHIKNPQDIKTVVEVGINEGEGTKRLKNQFPNAHIFAIDVHVRHHEYNLPYDQIAAKLEGIATIIIEKSPFPFEWGQPYDLCTMDIGSDPDINFDNIQYWIKYKKPGGVLVAAIPRGTELKLQKRQGLIERLKTQGFKFEEVYYNWIIFR